MSAVESELFNFFQCCRSIGSWKASPAGGLLVSKEYRRLSVAKIQKHYITERKAPTSYILSQMSKDKRRGVQKAYQSIQKRKKNKLREQHRLKQLLQIETELKDQQWQLRYADNGNGINQETKNQIFEPFFSTRRDDGFSGLGMHLVSNIVNHSLGKLELKIKSTKYKQPPNG